MHENIPNTGRRKFVENSFFLELIDLCLKINVLS